MDAHYRCTHGRPMITAWSIVALFAPTIAQRTRISVARTAVTAREVGTATNSRAANF